MRRWQGIQILIFGIKLGRAVDSKLNFDNTVKKMCLLKDVK